MPWVPLEDLAPPEPGDAAGVDVGDEELVVWRTASGHLCAMDARCPHQWSYLGAEGFVDGEELVCAAHHWRFGVDGRGSKRNVFGRRDPKADIAVFPVRVRDGRVEVELPG